MMKMTMKIGLVGLAIAALTACGERVEVPPSYVGKVVGQSGYKGGVVETSRFRLDVCAPWAACDRLVLLSSGDTTVNEPMSMMMPKDKLKMSYTIVMNLAVNPKKIDEIYSRVAPNEGVIDRKVVYDTYAKPIILSESREILSKYSIGEIMSNLDQINKELSDTLTKSISEKTPFVPRYVGIANPGYPDIIVNAQEAAAKRREDINQEEAQLEISKVALDRELQEQRMKRKIDIERAESEAEVNRIIARSVTPSFVQYRNLDILEKLAASNNKTFVPLGSLNSVAVQNNIGQ